MMNRALPILIVLAIASAGAFAEDFKKVEVKYTAAQKSAMDAIEKSGGLVMRLAQSSDAHRVDFHLQGTELTDAGLAQLKNVPNLIDLNLGGTKVTDAGLKTVGSIKSIQRLNLNNTKITDAGLASLKGLSNLSYLNLYGCEGVTNKGIGQLKGLTKLRALYLWKTKATKDGAKNLEVAIKGLRTNTGWDLTPVKAVPVAAKPALKTVNLKCPITKKDVDPSKTENYKGKLVGFCCANCLAKFKKNPAACFKNVKEDNPALKVAAAPKPINAKCPVSGKAVKAGFTAMYKGKLVGFCCNNCKAKFTKAPAKFAKKLKI